MKTWRDRARLTVGAITMISLWSPLANAAPDQWIIAGIGQRHEREIWILNAASIRYRPDAVGFMQNASPEAQDAFYKQLLG